MAEEMLENKTQPNYYAIIPANVRYCKDISSTAKLLYAEISCLTNFKGYCFAKNEYFAELYDISENRVSKIIKELKDNGFINISLKRNSNNFVTERIITLVDFKESDEENTSSPLAKITMDDGKNDISPLAKITTPIGKNDKYNIKSINNNIINNNTNSNSSEIPFPEPEDVEPKKIKRTRTASKKPTDENSVSFSKESYTEVMDLYYDTRLSLNNQMTVTDEVYKYNIYTPLLKKYFELYGVEKCKLAIKNASTNEWVRNKTDFGLRTIFNDKMITKFLEDTSVVTNKALRHDMFFNDPKHSHIDYENQDYTEEF